MVYILSCLILYHIMLYISEIRLLGLYIVYNDISYSVVMLYNVSLCLMLPLGYVRPIYYYIMLFHSVLLCYVMLSLGYVRPV